MKSLVFFMPNLQIFLILGLLHRQNETVLKGPHCPLGWESDWSAQEKHKLIILGSDHLSIPSAAKGNEG